MHFDNVIDLYKKKADSCDKLPLLIKPTNESVRNTIDL